jgi:double-stranded uracil-DNA glycosylase
MNDHRTELNAKSGKNAKIQGFAPIYRQDARVLILGTLPGQASLEAGQYYAQPKNSFWEIMSDIVGAELGVDYETSLERLKNAGIAIWDVLESAERKSSLDKDIDNKTAIPNDFDQILEDCSTMDLICFNGRKSSIYYQRLVVPKIKKLSKAIKTIYLPSTSSAYRRMSFLEKLESWRRHIAPHLLPEGT